jgi:hypothetical protein
MKDHEALVNLLRESITNTDDGAGSDLDYANPLGDGDTWIELEGNLDIHHLASDILIALANAKPEPPLVLQRGVYRNTLGAELVVTDPAAGNIGPRVIGELWWAEHRDELFGTTQYLVTAEGLRSAGYESAG